VYSTCTVFHEENENVVEEFISHHPEFRLDPIDKVLPERCHLFVKGGYFRTFPRGDGMDGFFAARLTKER
jgi:16S rRNA (cytosine967-C5)-methyltransferase